jgi:hypothetical protein
LENVFGMGMSDFGGGDLLSGIYSFESCLYDVCILVVLGGGVKFGVIFGFWKFLKMVLE